MKYFVFVLLSMLLMAAPLQAAEAPAPAPVAYEMLPARSWLKFTATQNSALVEGEFKDFTVEALFHPENVEASKIKVEVAPASVWAAYEDMAQELVKPEWFNAAKFPKAVFVSEKILKLSPENFIAEGKLTIRNRTAPVSLNFMFQPKELGTAKVTGSLTLKRNDFGVGQGAWAKTDVVKNDVVVRFQVEAKKKY